MQFQATEIFSPDAIRNGICVVDGYGLRVAAERKHLVISDGIGRARRVRTFTRSDRRLKRVVVIGNSGTISLDALRWLGDVGVSLVHIDKESRVLAVSAVEGTDNPGLRRVQALAAGTSTGFELAKMLICGKLEGQLKISQSLSDAAGPAQVIATALEDLYSATELDEVRVAESVAASVYWPALAIAPVHFVRSDVTKVPDHWQSIGTRSSPLSQSARSAVTPAHAIWNYCYALLVAETRTACLTMGLDPGLGFLHADKAGRDSLVADAMEPVRPAVDAFVLELLDGRYFRASDFVETRQGSCRLLAPLTHELAESARDWGLLAGAVVEAIARDLKDSSQGKVRRVATPITQRSRSAAARQVLARPVAKSRLSARTRVAICRLCGDPVLRSDYQYCDACRAARKAEQLIELQSARAEASHQRIASGDDPLRTEDALAKQRAAMQRRNREAREWVENGGIEEDSAAFTAEILPGIQQISLRLLAQATGLSRSYLRDVRDGKYVPHPRHWAGFRELLSSDVDLPG